ncbi:MAG: hypothetical protein KDE33_09165 [Bacteroidetes bacterium]|nr:hypothetical protein [Bacteroidota bacterium]MCB9227522.1 hypothetical protein [Chitinophagales bacterium]
MKFVKRIVYLALTFIFVACSQEKIKKCNEDFTVQCNMDEVNLKCLIEAIPPMKYDGVYCQLYANSLDTAVIMKFIEGKKNGEWKWYYKNGNIMSTAFFQNDTLTDFFYQNYVNGKYHINIENVRFKGECYSLNSNYTIDPIKKTINTSHDTVKTTLFDGNWTYFWENGNKMKQFEVKDCRKVGLTTEWFENGQIAKKTEYLYGVKEGKSSTYDANGNHLFDEIYASDTLQEFILIDSSYTPSSTLYYYIKNPNLLNGNYHNKKDSVIKVVNGEKYILIQETLKEP